MSEQRNRKAINRLKTMYPLRAKVDESYRRSVEAMKEGKPTVWAMLNWYFGDPILRAMDLEVVYPENYSAALAAAGVADQYLDYSDTAGFPTHLCGYSRANFGYSARMMKDLKGEIPPEAPAGGMPKPVLLLSSTTICDARYKWFQALGRYMDVPVWTIDAPIPGVKEFFLEGSYKRMVDFGIKHAREFVSFTEQIVGRKMDWDKLDRTVNLMLEINRLWYEINQLRKAKPCPMHGRDFWSAMSPALFLMGDLDDVLQCYRDMYDEVKSRVDSKVGAVAEEKYRLLFAELPPWHSLDFFEKLAERGWNFVIESYAYQPPKPTDLSACRDPLERLVRFSLSFSISCYREALEEGIPMGPLAYSYIKYAREWECDGAFLHPLLSCRSGSTHLPYVSRILLEKMHIPSLTVEGDMVDLRLFDQEDALAKAEPFEEVMKHYRRLRKP